MDDLDHSMHIAEYDWTSFFEESEECSLLKPSIACPDSSGFSDSEDSENSSPVFSTDQWEKQQCPDVNNDGAEGNAIRCSTEGESCTKLQVRLNKSGTGGEQDDVTAKPNKKRVTQVDSDICLVCPAGNSLNTKEVHVKTAQEKDTTDNITGVSNGGNLETEIDNSRNEPDPSFLNQTELNVKEPHATEGALWEDVSSVNSRPEKERWFVTVNDSPARQRVAASSVKKKQKQKKPCKNTWSSRKAKSVESCLEIKDKNYSEGGRDKRGFTQLKQNFVQNSGGAPSAKINPDSSQMCCEKEKVSEILVISNSLKEHITEPMTDRNTHEPGSSASMSRDIFTLKDPSQVESGESDELEDGAEFFSIHSYDSESYLSAAESVEEPLYHLKDHVIKNQQLFLTTSNLLNTEHTQDREIHHCDSTLSCNASATNCDGYEGAGVERTLTFPSADQRANKMPDDNSTCDNDTHSTELCVPSDTPRLQKQEINLSASGSSSGHQLSPLPVTDLTVTPCSAANSSETYAEAAGHTRPVYAISAFWDEMEKLTINDILQLRMDRNTPTRETQETVTPNVHGFLTNDTFLVDTVENNLSDSGLMDTSDIADSDYFTQPDESKPDYSSCEFSTSDFEEEYWHFIGASRNPSPDPQDKNQSRTCDSPFLSHEELLSTCSEGKDTPVPSEDCAGQCFEDQESHTSIKPSRLRPITQSKTMHNVQALNTEDCILQSLFGNDESGLFLSCSQSLEENMALKVSDSMETLIPAPVLSSTDILDKRYQISIPDVFEYFFTEDKAKNDSRCVYNPEDISVAPVFACTLCTFRDKMSFSSLHDSQCSEEKPIPIFSCSHPTVRELTFPKQDYVFLNAGCEEEDISPIRVMSHSFTQASDCGAGASRSWKTLLSIRKICFHDKGSIWCRRSGAWVFPVVAEKTVKKRKDPPVTAVTEGRVSLTPTQLFRELAVQRRIWETIHTSKPGLSPLDEKRKKYTAEVKLKWTSMSLSLTEREGLLSTLKQSDMCLVCIAFASWVLRSSDPEAADAWKAGRKLLHWYSLVTVIIQQICQKYNIKGA